VDSVAPWLCAGLAGLALVGCSQEPAQQTSSAPKPAVSQEPAAEPLAVALVPAPAPAAAPAKPPTPQAQQAPPAPADFKALRGSDASPEDLRRWLQEAKTPPELQVVMLKDLEAQSEPDALAVAIQLASAKTSDRLVRANAVALLARSQDPRAGEALAALPEKYQRLAKALRKTQ